MDIFLKSGIFGLAIVLAFVLLFVAGIVVVAVAAITRSRKAAITFSLLAVLPFLLGLFGTYMGYRQVDAFVQDGQMFSPEDLNHPQGVVSAGRREARYPTYLGSGATGVLLVLAGVGVALARKARTGQR